MLFFCWLILALCSSTFCSTPFQYNDALAKGGHSLGRDLTFRKQSIGDKIITVVNKAFSKLGILECDGLGSLTNKGSFLNKIFGDNSGTNTLGNEICGPTCQGECVPLGSFAQAPTTVSYAVGCKCNEHNCNNQGPIPTLSSSSSYEVVCERDESCSCAGMGLNFHGAAIPQTGYLCNWRNLENKQKVTFAQLGNQGPFKLHLSMLPVSWCSCCPTV